MEFSIAWRYMNELENDLLGCSFWSDYSSYQFDLFGLLQGILLDDSRYSRSHSRCLVGSFHSLSQSTSLAFNPFLLVIMNVHWWYLLKSDAHSMYHSYKYISWWIDECISSRFVEYNHQQKKTSVWWTGLDKLHSWNANNVCFD